MSLILHLSDLHLGSPSATQRDYEDKFGAGDDAGVTEGDHLAHTLTALAASLASQDRVLDAVVVSGDLTKGNEPDGYEEFNGFLEDKLGKAMPEGKRVIVVPGNHDVDAKLPPGDPRKFKRFLDAARSSYATPLIKNLDYEKDKLSRSAGGRGKPRPIVDLGDAVIVAINSAEYCWTCEEKTDTDWDGVLNDYAPDGEPAEVDAKREAASEELMRLRTQDIPKIDKWQFKALQARLDKAGVDNEADSDPRLRIAVLHHPIGIASNQEEIKPFEVITNLGALRTFLYHRGFHLVLHGHKHQSYAAWDWLVPPGDDLDVVPRRALVLGASGRFRIDESICRLIEVCPDGDQPVAGAPRLRIVDIEGVETAEELELDFKEPVRSLAQPFMSSWDEDTPWVVKAKTADAAYQQLRDLPAKLTRPRPVISVVEDADSTKDFPVNFRRLAELPPLMDLVKWWQLERPDAVRSFSGSEFNHGQRLYADGESAIGRAVLALPSSKAIALLVKADEAGMATREFPSFTQVQLQLRDNPEGSGVFLDVVGLYRKQDLELWWPVNMAELAAIQKRALKAVPDNPKLTKAVEPGRLIAMTTIGVHDDVLPQMAGTALDRAVDLRPGWPFKLAHLLTAPAPEAAREWEHAIGDIGERKGDGLLVPSIGVERLLEALEMHLETDEVSVKFKALVRKVKTLCERAEGADKFLRKAAEKNDGKPASGDLDSWSAELKLRAKEVERLVRAILREAERSGASDAL